MTRYIKRIGKCVAGIAVSMMVSDIRPYSRSEGRREKSSSFHLQFLVFET